MAESNPPNSPKSPKPCSSGNGQNPSTSKNKNRPAAELILPPPPPVEDLDDLLLDEASDGAASVNPRGAVTNNPAVPNPAKGKGNKSKSAKRKLAKIAKKQASVAKDSGNQEGRPNQPVASTSSAVPVETQEETVETTPVEEPVDHWEDLAEDEPSDHPPSPTVPPSTNRLNPERYSSMEQILARRPLNPLLNADLLVYNHGNGRCNVCVVQFCTSHVPIPTTPLLQCCGCRLIFYCTSLHQRADWSAHKPLCRIVRTILRSKTLEHIYGIRGNFRFSSQRNFLITRAEVLRVVETGLNRPLKAAEKNQLAWPKMCAVCNQHDSAKLDDCKFCHAAWFCRGEHRDGQIIAIHQPAFCIQLRLYYSLVIFGEPRTIPHPDPLPRLRPGEPFPHNLFNLVNLSANTDFTANPLTDAQNLDFAAVCNFSSVATLLTAIRQAEVLDEKQKDLYVHIVGASSEITLFTRHECWLLFRWLPAHIKRIELVFVGPDLPEGLAEYRDLLFSKNLRCRLRFARMCYEDYKQTANAPHLCICYNSGFLEKARSTEPNPWTAGMNRIMDVCSNIAFTSYVRVEAEADLNWVIQIASGRQALPFVWQRSNNPNEYRDLRPHRNAHMQGNDREEIYFCNGYLCVMTLNKQP